jgi:chitinase
VSIPVVLAAPSARTLSVTLATADGTAVAGTDYVASSTTVTFPAGSTVQYVPVKVLHRPATVPNRTFTVKLSGATGLTQLSSSSATVTLIEHTADATG